MPSEETGPRDVKEGRRTGTGTGTGTEQDGSRNKTMPGEEMEMGTQARMKRGQGGRDISESVIP